MQHNTFLRILTMAIPSIVCALTSTSAVGLVLATSTARHQQTACEMHDTSAMIVIIVFTIVTFACMHLHLHACKSKLNAPTSCMHVHVLVCIHLDAI